LLLARFEESKKNSSRKTSGTVRSFLQRCPNSSLAFRTLAMHSDSLP
jgi:hypothetical protein